MRLLILCGVLLELLAAFGGSAQAGLLYTVTDLGALPGGDNSSQAFAINNRGQVVGMSSVADGSHAFLYSNGAMTDLGLLAEVAQLEARTLVIPGDFGCSGRKSSLQKPIRAEPFRQVQL